MQFQLDDTINSIIKGLLNGNEDEVVGNMLLQTNYSLNDLTTNDEASFTKIYEFLTPKAFAVLAQLKAQLGEQMELIDEDGDVVELDGE